MSPPIVKDNESGHSVCLYVSRTNFCAGDVLKIIVLIQIVKKSGMQPILHMMNMYLCYNPFILTLFRNDAAVRKNVHTLCWL